MSIENRLSPSQDPGVENEIIGFDFGAALAAGEAVSTVTSVTCTVSAGFDSAASSRLSGGNMVVPSLKTGAPNARVTTKFGGQLAGTTYQLQCIVVTTLGQNLSIITFI